MTTEKLVVELRELLIMARPKAKAPSLRYHISGQSVVTIDGADYYLGKHDSPESIARYAVLIGIYQKGGLKLPSDFKAHELDEKAAVILGQLVQPSQQAVQPLTVRHVTASYRAHIKTKYAGNKAELHRLNQICDEADKHEGDREADDFGPLALQRQRQRWIDGGSARGNRLGLDLATQRDNLKRHVEYLS